MDREEFDKVLEAHYRQVINIAYRFLNNQAAAEDIAQEVFLRFYRVFPRYKPEAKFSTYLYKMTKNLCLNYLRQRKPERFISLDAPGREGENSGPDIPDEKAITAREIMEKEELKAKIYEALNKLPESQRTAVILRRYENLDYEEIARILGCSVGAVKSLLHRAKLSLRKELAGYLKS
jgi:RNA polymerase sigma-70 factor (ECF subfamily)